MATVLIVDDEPATLAILATDVMMRFFNGLELCRSGRGT
jgi:CheY-like chemotaxis protein